MNEEKIKELFEKNSSRRFVGTESTRYSSRDLFEQLMSERQFEKAVNEYDELTKAKIELANYMRDNAVRNKPTEKYYWFTTDVKVITKYLDTINKLEQK